MNYNFRILILIIFALFVALIISGCAEIVKKTEYKFIYPEIPKVNCELYVLEKNPASKDYKDSDSADVFIGLYEKHKICYKSKVEQDKFLDNLKKTPTTNK